MHPHRNPKNMEIGLVYLVIIVPLFTFYSPIKEASEPNTTLTYTCGSLMSFTSTKGANISYSVFLLTKLTHQHFAYNIILGAKHREHVCSSVETNFPWSYIAILEQLPR
jgi:hypothetical protein